MPLPPIGVVPLAVVLAGNHRTGFCGAEILQQGGLPVIRGCPDVFGQAVHFLREECMS